MYNQLAVNARCHSVIRRSAFSLVELLVVISILGILIALIFPIINSVQRSFHRAECVNNLRQVGLATQFYIQNNAMRLPGPLWGGQEAFFPGASTGQLLRYLEPYLETPIVSTPGSPRTRAAVMLCPAFPDDIDPLNARHYVLNSGKIDVGDNEAQRAFGRPGGEVDGSDDMPVLLTQIRNPAKDWMLKDLDQQGTKGYAGNPLAPEAPVHGNVRNTLFFDGHVESVSLD